MSIASVLALISHLSWWSVTFLANFAKFLRRRCWWLCHSMALRHERWRLWSFWPATELVLPIDSLTISWSYADLFSIQSNSSNMEGSWNGGTPLSLDGFWKIPSTKFYKWMMTEGVALYFRETTKHFGRFPWETSPGHGGGLHPSPAGHLRPGGARHGRDHHHGHDPEPIRARTHHRRDGGAWAMDGWGFWIEIDRNCGDIFRYNI